MAPTTSSTDPLRPTTLRDFRGQPQVATELRVVLGGAASRDETPPHMLLTGPPGLGKTTLAGIVAHDAGLPLISTSAPLLEKPGDLVSLLVSLTQPSVVFIDEVHQLPKNIEETLYTAMEDQRVDIVIAEGTRKARTIPMHLEPFTLIGATTKAGLLGAPFRDRFGYTARLTPYDTPTLAGIVTRSADKLNMPIAEEGATYIASCSRGTPRVANQWLRRARDYAATHDHRAITADVARDALHLFGVDERGLDAGDRALLRALTAQFNGGPVGVSTLATAIGETVDTVAEVHEPFLIQAGLLARTSRGRVATDAAYTHLGLQPPAGQGQQPALDVTS